jgi:hypothetical protein
MPPSCCSSSVIEGGSMLRLCSLRSTSRGDCDGESEGERETWPSKGVPSPPPTSGDRGCCLTGSSSDCSTDATRASETTGGYEGCREATAGPPGAPPFGVKSESPPPCPSPPASSTEADHEYPSAPAGGCAPEPEPEPAMEPNPTPLPTLVPAPGDVWPVLSRLQSKPAVNIRERLEDNGLLARSLLLQHGSVIGIVG